MAEKYSNLSVKSWAATGAIMWGIYLCLSALFAMVNINTFGFSNKMFDSLVSLYPGLSANLMGALLGLVYGAVCGGLCAGLFAYIHNWTSTKIK